MERMAVAFLRLTEPAGVDGPETAASEALKRRHPLLLVLDALDHNYDIQSSFLIVEPPSDAPQLPVWLTDEWDAVVQFGVAAIIVAGARDSYGEQALLDKYISELWHQIANSHIPIFYYDPLGNEIPAGLNGLLTDYEENSSTLETLSLPLFLQAAGGELKASMLVDQAVTRRQGDEQTALETFAAEARGVLSGVTEFWSFDAAISWLTSPNALLNGSRPMEVLVLQGSGPVVDASYATQWGLIG